jgi:hypothetical protein
MMRWDLIPYWAKDIKIGARVEEVSHKPASAAVASCQSSRRYASSLKRRGSEHGAT